MTSPRAKQTAPVDAEAPGSLKLVIIAPDGVHSVALPAEGTWVIGRDDAAQTRKHLFVLGGLGLQAERAERA